jgi:hypothetical protein
LRGRIVVASGDRNKFEPAVETELRYVSTGVLEFASDLRN